jgi:hypothetical protein
MLKLDPSWAQPYTDIVLPKRMKARIDKELPR